MHHLPASSTLNRSNHNVVPITPSADRAYSTSLDFDTIWNTFGVQANITENPFEPTPISPYLDHTSTTMSLVGVNSLNKRQSGSSWMKDDDTHRCQNLCPSEASASMDPSCAPQDFSLQRALACFHQNHQGIPKREVSRY